MKKSSLSSLLEELGLSENESQVYLATLALGPSTILKIAKAAELKRTTVYSVIESLKQKGLITIEVNGFKKLFAAENPEKLDAMIETRRNRLKQSLPELTALYNLKGGESFVKYYEGMEAIKSIYENLIRDIKPHEDYLIIGNNDKWMALAPDFFSDFLKRRAKLNINIRVLLQESHIAREHQKHQKIYHETVRLLPSGTDLITNLVITPQRVVIHQLTLPIIAIVIENKSVIQMQQQLFDIIWNATQDK